MSSQPDPSVAAMRTLCNDLTKSIDRGDLPPATMAELKKIVDEARLRLWASMESAKEGDPTWAQEFWLQRAADMCLAATQQLEEGEVNPASPRARELRQVAERLAASFHKGSG